MSQTPNAAMVVIGIDIGKNSFHVVGHDARGAIVLRQPANTLASSPGGSAASDWTRDYSGRIHCAEQRLP